MTTEHWLPVAGSGGMYEVSDQGTVRSWVDHNGRELPYVMSENRRDRIAHGTDHQLNKTHCPQSHPYSLENTYVAARGDRQCRTCHRERVNAARTTAEDKEIAHDE